MCTLKFQYVQPVKLKTSALITYTHCYKTLTQDSHEIIKVVTWVTPINIIIMQLRVV